MYLKVTKVVFLFFKLPSLHVFLNTYKEAYHYKTPLAMWCNLISASRESPVARSGGGGGSRRESAVERTRPPGAHSILGFISVLFSKRCRTFLSRSTFLETSFTQLTHFVVSATASTLQIEQCGFVDAMKELIKIYDARVSGKRGKGRDRLIF